LQGSAQRRFLSAEFTFVIAPRGDDENTTRINAVAQAGRFISRKDLGTMLAGVEAANASAAPGP
jgi:hypothetical protein